MSHEKGNDSNKYGTIELADDFVIIQPIVKKSKLKSSIVVFIVFSVITLILFFYYISTHPLLTVMTETKQILSENVLPGLPVFLDNQTIIYCQKDPFYGTRIVFKKVGTYEEEKSIYSNNNIEYLNPTFTYSKSGEQKLAFTIRRYNTPRIVCIPMEGYPSILPYGEWASFSKDGNLIAFHRNVDDQSEIWVMNFDGTGQKSTDLKGRRPEWSPVKDEIVFESGKPTKESIIQLVNIEDIKNAKNLTSEKESCFYPCFSPDGNLIIFFKKGSGLWVMKRDGSKQERILQTEHQSEIMMGRISPDGQKIAVWSGKNDEGKIYIYNINYKRIRPPEKKINIDKLVILVESIKNDLETKSEQNSSVQSEDNITSPTYEPQAYLSLINVKPETGFILFIDDKKIEFSSIDKPIPIEPGRHSIRLENPETGTLWEEYHEFSISETYIPKDIDLR